MSPIGYVVPSGVGWLSSVVSQSTLTVSRRYRAEAAGDRTARTHRRGGRLLLLTTLTARCQHYDACAIRHRVTSLARQRGRFLRMPSTTAVRFSHLHAASPFDLSTPVTCQFLHGGRCREAVLNSHVCIVKKRVIHADNHFKFRSVLDRSGNRPL